MSALPAPRTPGCYRVALVCLGNICRSPMADVVLNDRVRAAGLDDRVEVVSAGTGDWHVGQPMDRRAAVLLEREGYDGSAHRAQQVAALLERLADTDDTPTLLLGDLTNGGLGRDPPCARSIAISARSIPAPQLFPAVCRS